MKRAHRAGFTLIEVLVSLVIAALAVTNLLSVVRDAFERDDRLVARLRMVDGTIGLFALLDCLLATTTRELRDEPAAGGASAKIAGGTSASARHPAVSGTADTLTIWSQGPRVLGLSQSVAFTLTHDTGGDSPGPIILRWRTPEGSQESETVLSAQTLRLRYGAKTERGTVAWYDRWSGPIDNLSLIEASVGDGTTGRLYTRSIAVVPVLPKICARPSPPKECPQWH